ncbi:MAG: hypothetical protein IPH31_21325 [Lewinellaceae bacterium]|nr:hypothetical protein [Lewinellaceae bacterium]
MAFDTVTIRVNKDRPVYFPIFSNLKVQISTTDVLLGTVGRLRSKYPVAHLRPLNGLIYENRDFDLNA